MVPEADHKPRQQRRAAERTAEGRMKADFRVFLYAVWKHLGLPEPTPVQYDIASYLQHGPRRKMIQAFRGVGKSWVFGAFTCWLLYCNPDRKVMIVSASKPLADAMAKFIKSLIAEMPILQHLRPREGQMDRNDTFDVGPARTSKDPSVKSVGIFGQITGSRADDILADDIESLNNSATEAARERLGENVKEFDAVLKPGNSSVTYLGTPQSAMTMYAKLPERGYDLRIWPARVPSEPRKYGGRLAPFIDRMIAQGALPGTPVDPRRFNDQDLIEREASYGRTGFALQFMLDTSLNDRLRFPLKLSDLLVMPLDPKRAPISLAWSSLPEYVVQGVHVTGLPGDKYFHPMFRDVQTAEYTGTVMAVDPSGMGKDETGYAVVRHLMGFLFLADAGGLQGGYADDALDRLVKIAKKHGVQKVIVEGNFGGGMFAKLLLAAFKKDGYPVAVEEVTHSKQKELRIIDTLEPVLNSHRLVVDQDLINRDHESTQSDAEGLAAPYYGLFWQLTHLTKDRGSLRHDDRLDALAMAVGYWVEQMAIENGREAKKHSDKALADELRKFVRGVRGLSSGRRVKAIRAR